MLNENKVKMMTKMAIYEKNEGKRMLKTSKYYKGDYIGFGVLRTIITTTIAFVIILLLCVICDSESLVANANSLDYLSLGKTILAYYVGMIVVFVLIAILVYNNQYTKSRAGLKKYFSRLNKLEHFYNSKRKN